ncbi:MAG TPA: ferritin family protein [Anaerolineales bacterium]|nr:ferritin family protein [Anaerolineales bacterium]
MDIRKIYEYALSREYEGKRFFEDNAHRLNQAAAVNAFKQLAGEEQKHIEYIQQQITLIDKGQVGNIDFGIMLEQSGFFSQRAQSEVIDQTVAEAMIPDLPVLRMAYLIERDFAEFYESMAEQASGEAKQVLSMLSQWERRHERLFKGFFDRAFEEYSKMPWGG